MPIHYGADRIGAIYYGSTAIARVYHGSTLVFDGAGDAGGNASFVGSHVQTYNGSGGTLNFSSLLDGAGATPTLAEGDTVFCYIARTTSAGLHCTPSGYTEIAVSGGSAWSRKVMGATPDTSLTVPSEGTAVGSAVAIVMVYSGIEPNSPIEVTPTTNSGSYPTTPNPPAITPGEDGSLILAGGYVTDGGDIVAALTKPSNLSSDTNKYRGALGSYSGSLNQTAAGAGVYESWEGGSFDPDAFGGGGVFASAFSITLAVRPYAAPVFGVTINETIPLSYTITGSPLGSATAWSWKRNGVEVSTTETGPTPTDDGASYTVDVTMTNGPYSATKTSANSVSVTEEGRTLSDSSDRTLSDASTRTILNWTS